jgi:hypothetical protein
VNQPRATKTHRNHHRESIVNHHKQQKPPQNQFLNNQTESNSKVPKLKELKRKKTQKKTQSSKPRSAAQTPSQD